MASLLIVSRDDNIIRVFQRCFENTDVMVHSVASWSAPQQDSMASGPDVVVLETWPTGNDGFTALEELRRSNPAIPVILITASDRSDVAIESTRLGAMDFLTKPLDVAKVRQVVGQAIGLSTRIRMNGNRKVCLDEEAARGLMLPAVPLLAPAPPCRKSTKPSAASPGRTSTS